MRGVYFLFLSLGAMQTCVGVYMCGYDTAAYKFIIGLHAVGIPYVFFGGPDVSVGRGCSMTGNCSKAIFIRRTMATTRHAPAMQPRSM